MIDKSINYRGKILHAICDLEFLLNSYISNHFCGLNNMLIQEMQNVVLGDDRISLSSKTQIFYHIAIQHHKKWFNDYISPRPHEAKKKPYNMNSDLVYAIEQRNILAHRILDREIFITNSEQSLKDGCIRFVKFKNEITPLDFNDEAIDKLFNLIVGLMQHFNKFIQNTLPPSSQSVCN